MIFMVAGLVHLQEHQLGTHASPPGPEAAPAPTGHAKP